MVIQSNADSDTPEQDVEARSDELGDEFHEHYLEYVTLHPEAKDRHEEIFQSWAIQKIAGIQLSIEHIAERFNSHLQDETLF